MVCVWLAARGIELFEAGLEELLDMVGEVWVGEAGGHFVLARHGVAVWVCKGRAERTDFTKGYFHIMSCPEPDTSHDKL